jgi:D-xylose transport system substrate-binding protein
VNNLFRRTIPLLAVLALGALLLAAAASGHRTSQARSSATIKACALLPDTTSSTRYTLFDAPYLKKAFKAAKIPATVLNAHADAQKQKSQAQQCLAQGAKVILLDQLDPASGAAITDLAVGQGAKVIDYDRLVVGSKAKYYVSFNNVTVGKFQGRGLVGGLKAKGTYGKHPVIAELNGGTTDNNAHLFKQGYDSILNPLYNKGTFKKATAGDQWTDWSAIKARQIFDQMLAANGNKINGVLAANDGLAGAVVASLKAHGLKRIPLTGQDATPTGVQFILAGWQTGTVYKSVKREAAAAATLAIKIIKGQKVSLPAIAKQYKGVSQKVSGTPSVLLTPVWVTKANYKLLFKDGFLKRSQVCIGPYKKYCK